LLLGIVLGMFIIVNPRITVFGLIMILSSSVAVNVIKSILPELRPAAALADVHVVGPILRSGSFPSGHSAAVFATCLTRAHFSPSPLLKIILILFGTLVGLSRIFVGAHFPNDVVWGIIVSLALYELLCEFVWPGIEVYVPERPPLDNRFFRALLSFEVATALFCLVIYSQVFAEYPPVAIGTRRTTCSTATWPSPATASRRWVRPTCTCITVTHTQETRAATISRVRAPPLPPTRRACTLIPRFAMPITARTGCRSAHRCAAWECPAIGCRYSTKTRGPGPARTGQ